jgi:hypothetical protein
MLEKELMTKNLELKGRYDGALKIIFLQCASKQINLRQLLASE